MRILWFTNTPSCYNSSKTPYNGGGWISSAEKMIKRQPDIQLGISFILKDDKFKIIRDNVTYYPVNINKSLYKRVTERMSKNIEYSKKNWPLYVEQFKKVIDDFQPDIIQVFGSENYFGLIGSHTSIPVVLHIQGILNPYLNAFLPPHMSWNIYNKSISRNNFKEKIKLLLFGSDKNLWEKACLREREIYKRIHYYLGRTTWDKRVTKIMNTKAKYYECGEILREEFYTECKRSIPSKLTIVTTISNSPYKGFDLLLKTAYLLKYNLQLDFEWKVYGNINASYVEKQYNIYSDNVNVKLMGVANAKDLRAAELSATLYVHTSYIDNSPNSLCEAQILGLTCIATNVGGIPSLINDGKSGFIVPANDPYQLAYLINKLYLDIDLNYTIGNEARSCAMRRHNPSCIISNLLKIYKLIIDENKQ